MVITQLYVLYVGDGGGFGGADGVGVFWRRANFYKIFVDIIENFKMRSAKKSACIIFNEPMAGVPFDITDDYAQYRPTRFKVPLRLCAIRVVKVAGEQPYNSNNSNGIST